MNRKDEIGRNVLIPGGKQKAVVAVFRAESSHNEKFDSQKAQDAFKEKPAEKKWPDKIKDLRAHKHWKNDMIFVNIGGGPELSEGFAEQKRRNEGFQQFLLKIKNSGLTGEAKKQAHLNHFDKDLPKIKYGLISSQLAQNLMSRSVPKDINKLTGTVLQQRQTMDKKLKEST